MDTGPFPGVKRPGRGVDHPPSSADVKENVELYLKPPPPLGLRRFATANFTFLLMTSLSRFSPDFAISGQIFLVKKIAYKIS